jgi:hypothetical protein
MPTFLFRSLIAAPKQLSTASRFTTLNGLLYMSAGALLLVWPAAMQTLWREEDFVGHEAGLVRVVGLTVTIIGWLYFFGGRSGSTQIVAASIFDRLILVPLVLFPLAWHGVFPRFSMTFGILDPVLGLITWYLMKQKILESLRNNESA